MVREVTVLNGILRHVEFMNNLRSCKHLQCNIYKVLSFIISHGNFLLMLEPGHSIGWSKWLRKNGN